MIAGSCMPWQNFIPNGRIAVNYQDGTQQILDLIPPYNYDCLIREHFAETTHMEPLDKDCHADILDILTEPNKTIANIEFSCVVIETIIGVMGVTVVTP